MSANSSSSVPAILKYLNDSSNYNIHQNSETSHSRGKKRRLDHLSWEEKIQRKKLKNRVAAQTSRDRKKAKMDEMERALQELFERTVALQSRCDDLRQDNERLTEENSDLHDRLSNLCPNCSSRHQSRTVVCEAQSGTAGSLLLPRGLATHSAASLMTDRQRRRMTTATTAAAMTLMKVVLVCLLYPTCLMNSMRTSMSALSNNSPKASSRISPETWRPPPKKQILKNPPQLSSGNVTEKWWGRHQNAWNPPDVAAY